MEAAENVDAVVRVCDDNPVVRVCDDNPISNSPSSPGASGPADVHQSFESQRLRLVCPNHKDKINIKQLEALTFEAHHRAVVYLLICVAGSEVWCKDNRTAGREDRMLNAYKKWVLRWRKAQPDCRVNDYLMKRSPTKDALIEKQALVRRFTEYVKAPLLKCDKECRKLLEFDGTGWKPRDGCQWMQVLQHVQRWWFKQRCINKELDNERRKRKRHNDSEDVTSGRVTKWTGPVQIREGWQPPEFRGGLDDPVIPLISRFCPLLCSGLGFEESPSCFIDRRPEKPALLLPTPNSTNQHMIVYPRSVETNAVQRRRMSSMSKTLPSGTGGRQEQWFTG